jgi:DNA polymerase I-like protein with 3'-5' exonuclease and polymerase domains
LESLPSVTVSEYTKRQQNVLDLLNSAILKTGIDLRINPFGCGINYPLALDVEHDEQGNMVGIGLYSSLGEACYFTKIDQSLKETIEKADIIAHNGVSDFECLRMWGINVRDEQLIWDTMLMGHILDSSKKDYSLKGMADKELGIVYPSYEDIVGKRGLKLERITLDKQPLELVAKYNALDTYCTWKLYEQQKTRIL